MAEMQRQPVSLGHLVITANAQLTLVAEDVFAALIRHQRADWGDLDADDKAVNNGALRTCDRLVSVYHDSRRTRFYIITDTGWRVTTVLLPEDY